MRQVWSEVSSYRRSAADCSCGILVCGKSRAKFHPAADLPQTVPVAYWYAASLQQNFILPQICRRLFLWHIGMRQVCSKISFCRILRHTLCRRLKVCRRAVAGLRQVCGILFTFLWGVYPRARHELPSLTRARHELLVLPTSSPRAPPFTNELVTSSPVYTRARHELHLLPTSSPRAPRFTHELATSSPFYQRARHELPSLYPSSPRAPPFTHELATSSPFYQRARHELPLYP